MKFDVTLKCPIDAGVRDVADYVRDSIKIFSCHEGNLSSSLFGAFHGNKDVKVRRIFVGED